MVIGVDGSGFIKFLAVKKGCSVGNDLIQIHVGLGATAGLPHGQGELVVVPASEDLVADLHDEGAARRVQAAQCQIALRGRLLDQGEGANEAPVEAVSPNAEVLQ